MTLSRIAPNNSFKPNPYRGCAKLRAFGYFAPSRRVAAGQLNSDVRRQNNNQLEIHLMKAYGFVLLASLLIGCTTTGAASGDAPQATSDYIANRQADGSIEIIVTGTTAVPTSSSEAKLELGSMLEAAAAKECPGGFSLAQDKIPTVRTDSKNLIGTLRGVARCK